MQGKIYIAFALAFLCFGFTICDKKVKTDGRVSRIYIYPDCNDTSTYLKQRYQAFHIVEYVYINSRLRYRRILDKAGRWVLNSYTYEGKKELHTIDTLAGDIPDHSYAINDTCALNVEYYADGACRICTYGYNRANECRHTDSFASSIVFDSLYRGKMTGNLRIICDTNEVIDAYSNEELVKIVHRERQTGLWRIYDSNDMKKDSVVYNN